MFRTWGKLPLRNLSTAVESKLTSVKIPPAIKRSKTALLEALSSTVGVDPTAPHFAFIDDPATIPSTASNKRNYYMAKELGKRAARQLAEEWPTLFAFDRDEPRLPAFRPQKTPDPLQVEPTEENLLKMIEAREIEDAAMLFERMRSDNLDVSEETQIKLFQVVCYYNGKNPPFSELEEWHGLRNFGEVSTQKWTQAGLADLLFESLPQSPETVSTLICGLCKFPSTESIQRAQELFKEHSRTLHREAFDSIISVSNWKDVKNVLEDMKSAKIKPEISTFDAILRSSLKADKDKRILALESVFGEISHLGLQPTLRTYGLALQVSFDLTQHMDGNMSDTEVAKLKKSVTWLAEILHELECRSSIETINADDFSFFLDAMGICSRASNLELAERVVKLYESSSNNVKMCAFTSEGLFYNRYLTLFVDMTNSIEDIFNKYRSLVPRNVGVNRQLTQQLLEKMKTNKHWPLLLRVIEDGIASRQMIDTRLGMSFRERLMDISYEYLDVMEREQYSALIRRMVDIWVEFSQFTEDYAKRMQLKLSPLTISECAVLLNRIGETERAYELLEKLLDQDAMHGDEATVLATGYARQTAVSELFEEALKMRDPVKAALCLEIIGQSTPRNKLEVMCQRVLDRCTVTEEQRRLFTGFVRLRPQ